MQRNLHEYVGLNWESSRLKTKDNPAPLIPPSEEPIFAAKSIAIWKFTAMRGEAGITR